MPVSDKLKKLYADAFEAGLFVKEFSAEEGSIAFAGSIRKLENAGYDKTKRASMDLIEASLYMAGEGGKTREEAVEKAIEMYRRSDSWIPTS